MQILLTGLGLGLGLGLGSRQDVRNEEANLYCMTPASWKEFPSEGFRRIINGEIL